MKLYHALLVSVLFSFLCACSDDDQDEQHPYKSDILWVPILNNTTINDGSITLKWNNSYMAPYGGGIETRCMMMEYTDPEKFEIYQSDNPDNGFRKIQELTNNNSEMMCIVKSLTNGIPVYFYVKSVRKGHEENVTSTIMLVPNPKLRSEVLFTVSADNASEIALSRNQNQIAYVNTDFYQDYRLYIRDLNGEANEVLIDTKGQNPSWSPDGTKLVYAAGVENPYIALYDCQSKEIKKLTTKDSMKEDKNPSFSKDGSKILYASITFDDLVNNIRMIDLNTMEDTLLVDARKLGYSSFYAPQWIDDSTISLTAFPETYSMPGMRIFTTPIEEVNPSLLLDSRWEDGNAVASPDNQSIAFVSYRSGSPGIWIYNKKNKSYRQITGYQANEYYGLFTNSAMGWIDNSTFYYTANQQELVKLYIQ